MPITPATAMLFDSAYVQVQFPVVNARLKETHSDIVISAPVSGAGDKASKVKAECSANPGKYCAKIIILSCCFVLFDCDRLAMFCVFQR